MEEGMLRTILTGGWIRVEPVIQAKLIRSLCYKKYPNHPKGCPNFGKRRNCPPNAGIFDEVYDASEVYAVFNAFDIGKHIAKMKDRHPEWSERQLVNCLYWQGTARKALKADCAAFYSDYGSEGFHIESCPEAMGVNVTETMKNIGIVLEWPPRKKAYQIAMAAIQL